MRETFPLHEPHDSGMLAVGDGQEIYYQVVGDPHGRAVVDLHGGPGGAISKNRPKLFDPAVYRVIQFDQRGCGRSTPHVSDFAVGLEANTTQHLVADMEKLRVHLGVERWVVWGGSWGVTLGLEYAETFPERVIAMILVSITLSRARDFLWFEHDAGRFFPEAWERFRAGVPEASPGGLIAAYDRRMNAHPDFAVREQAVLDWVAWEDALLSHEEGFVVPHPRWSDRAYRVAFARLVTHYFSRRAFLEDDELLRNAGRLAGIPARLIHGRVDISGPPDIAWELARAWPGAELHIVPGGHLGGEQMAQRLLEAAHDFAAI